LVKIDLELLEDWGIALKADEKKSLITFLTIYISSALLLIIIIAILYYKKATYETKIACEKDLKSTILSVEMDLINSYLNNKKFEFNPKHYTLNVAMLTPTKKIKYSSLMKNRIDLNKTIDIKPNQIRMVKELKKTIYNVKYIVAEDIRMPNQLKKLKILIALTILISFIFISIIGYFLSRILLNPVKEQVKKLNRFIKDATHEINTPVTALLMSVSALKKKNIKEDKLLQHISISAKQIANIYNTLSHISFHEFIKENEIILNLKDEVIKSINFFEEIAKSKNITINYNLQNLKIKIDKDSLGKLINNLLSNAIKYTPNNSNIVITIKNNKLSIEDNGIGIKKEDISKILKRYTRVTDIGGGFGIGLDIVSSICKQYQLNLDIKSQVGKGSIFIIDFSNIKQKK